MARLLIVLAAFWLAAGAASAQEPVRVGGALPQSGLLADLAADLRKGLLLWQDEVNAAGGLLGRRVDLQLLDDRSESLDSSRIYEQLIKEHKADILVGPFGSAATLGAASVAERNRRVLINASGGARLVHKSAYRYVFQSATPIAALADLALDFARAQGAKKIFIIAREDPGSREAGQRAREKAGPLAAGELVVHGRGATEFGPQIASARAAQVDAWIAFGLPQDAAEMVKALRKAGYAPRIFIAQGVAEAEFSTRVGQDGELAVGISAYEPRAALPGNAQFVQRYSAKWSAEPGLLAAQGYAAGKLLEAAVQLAGSLEQGKVRDALAALEIDTVLGHHKLNQNGAQVASRGLLLQVVRGRREIVWPEALATAKWQPYAAWESRRLLK
jgi:branched-chain amino acid transport system substrate-binding protein